jgi:transposase
MLLPSHGLRYHLCTAATDMRKGFDGLSGIVTNTLGKDPVSGDVFIFINKPRSQVKLLYWDGDGFALYHKRLERGRYAHDTHPGPSRTLRREELAMLLEGLSYAGMKRAKRFEKK